VCDRGVSSQPASWRSTGLGVLLADDSTAKVKRWVVLHLIVRIDFPRIPAHRRRRGGQNATVYRGNKEAPWGMCCFKKGA
jgi:hypothetical protein